METTLEKFKRFCKTLDHKAGDETPPKPLRAKIYKLVKIVAGLKRDVAFGLTIFEAKELVNHCKRLLLRKHGPNDEGSPYFEITEIHLVEEPS